MKRKVWCATLGCDKNLVDSEALLGRFARRGVQPVQDPEDADIWVLNTCGFIDAARADSADTVGQLAAAKEGRTLVVCGCWSQEHGDTIRERWPQVDVVAGVGQFDRVVAACVGEDAAPAGPVPGLLAFPLAGKATAPIVADPLEAHYVGMLDRPLLTPPHVAFVKIGEGCNFGCTFCRIPLIRGKQRSRPVAEIAEEVRRLVERGVSEVQLVSQNTSDYGRDTGEKLLDLVRALDGVAGLRRQRLLYIYAGLVTVDDLKRLLDLPTVAPYLDIPVQHASPRILRAMRRPGGDRTSPAFFGELRRHRPDLVLRSTALLGFPGEEEEDVALLADFLAEVRFDHLGTYRYSAEAGTPSAALPDPVPTEVALDREALIADLQAEISQERQAARLGGRFEVVIDRLEDADDPDGGLPDLLEAVLEGRWLDGAERETLRGVWAGGGRVAVGRSHHYGYDLDGVVVLPAGGLEPGRWVTAEFTGASPYDTWARPLDGAGKKGT
ncbi:MAG: MiaB/RimO family radical SAM methylthiotransferase [Krumholzibacteria bacterium]|nr:MiaB/RimO family radical SAM methylthiotransferase [Candidatus Krumholzibacteria bacterium]